MWPSRANRQGRCRKNNTDAMMLYSEQSLDANYYQEQAWRDETRRKHAKGSRHGKGLRAVSISRATRSSKTSSIILHLGSDILSSYRPSATSDPGRRELYERSVQVLD